MIALEMRFLTGKYHATPWGRQVNEGAIEWPPAPWRILRALLAVWHHKFPDVPEDQVRRLMQKLSAIPAYRLPVYSSGHTRHFMPAANDHKTKIFDTFFSISQSDPIVICWPQVELSPDERELFEQLAAAMNYFGRAESWVEASVAETAPDSFNAVEIDEKGVGESQELVRLLAPLNEDSYVAWRVQMVKKLKQQKLDENRCKAEEKNKPTDKLKLSPKEITVIEQSLPETMFDALQVETDQLRKAGWNRPPASEWVDYVCDIELPHPIHAAKRIQCKQLPTIARFAIAGAVRPRLTEALAIVERSRMYVMGCSKKQNGGHCSETFSGKTVDGTPQGVGARTHGHAHFLAESLGANSNGRITHLSVYVPAGIDSRDEAALSRFTHMHGSDGHDLQVVPLGVGMPEDFGGLDERKGLSPLLGASRTWVSRTPFVPTDHLRIRDREKRDPILHAQAIQRELECLIRKELERRPWLAEFAGSVSIERISYTNLGGKEVSWLDFRRERQKGGGHRSTTQGYGFRLTFDREIQGPIILGYGAHFGLGIFHSV